MINHRTTILLVLFGAVFLLLAPTIGYASPSNANAAEAFLDNCKSNYPSWAIATTIVGCVEMSLRAALSSYIGLMTSYLAPTILAVMAFSMILIGLKIFGGAQELNKEVVLYILKFGLVTWFVINLGGFLNAPFDIVRYMTTLVVGGYSPWGQMDLFLCQFFGTNCQPNSDLSNGLMGLVGASLSSGLLGVLIFVLSMLTTITTVSFIFRGIHTYLASIALIAFVLLLSPLMIPLAMFARTTRYLYKWLDYLIAAMVHPVLLFAFLSMFLGMLNYMLNWFVFGIMGGNDYSGYWRNKKNLFSWLLTSDPQTVQSLESVLGSNTGRTAVQSFVSPSMSSAVDVNPITTFALDFGANQVWAMQLMVFGFLGLFIVAYLMLSMVNKLPEVSEAIAGVVIGLRVEGIPFINEMRYMFTKLKSAVGSGGGAS